ncbi:MAG TPA: hypothetical protein VEA92_02970 [Candidatus Paceibacterota bacterium]|nr:hypothetical protein [Candidatus Paceibacterota bacterium]
MNKEHDSLEALLKENIAVTRENNEMLHQMRRIGRIAFWTKVVIWTVVIILPLLLIGPILDSLTKGAGASVMGLPSADMIEEAYRLYTGRE